MNATLQCVLRATHPRLLAKTPIGVGDGWYFLLSDLFNQLDAECHTMPQHKRPTVENVEQKYGSLRVNLTSSTAALDGLILEAESKSETICERCGTPGALRSDKYWWETLCNECARKRAKR
jgi:hypothetical protein